MALRGLLGRASPVFSRIMTTSPLAGTTRKQPSSDMAAFREVFKNAKHVVALTGAGISAESGVPTFRGAGGLWRKYNAQNIATPGAFLANPSLVWEFYSYRRDLVLSKKPNPVADQAMSGNIGNTQGGKPCLERPGRTRGERII